MQAFHCLTYRLILLLRTSFKLKLTTTKKIPIIDKFPSIYPYFPTLTFSKYILITFSLFLLFTKQCPSGYYCNNCDNNKLTYTCSLNESNTPTWYRKGECVPNNCEVPSNPENNGIWVDEEGNPLSSGTKVNYGKKITGKCNDDGYTINVTATCLLNKNNETYWKHDGDSSCAVKKCPNDGNFGISTTLLNNRECKAGFTKYTEKKVNVKVVKM